MTLATAACALSLFAFGNDVESLSAHADKIDVAAPNWFALDGRGRLQAGGDPRYAAVAADRGVELWPVVNAQLGFRARWLADPDAVARRVAAIADRHDGVTLDIEELPPRARARYSAFVADVARRTRGGVAVYTVRRTAAAPLRSAAAYDHAALARSADLVLASGYGEHSPASAPGPITTRAGFARVLDHAASVSRDRIAPVLGGFGISWPLLGRGRGELVAAPRSTKVELRAGRIVWGETARSLRARKRAACRAGFKWVALFSLGREPAGFWH